MKQEPLQSTQKEWLATKGAPQNNLRRWMSSRPAGKARQAGMSGTCERRATKAFSLVEVILTGAIFALLVTVLVGAFLYGQEATALAGNRARAVLLAEEGLEAVRNMRDAGFANLTDGTHGLTISGNQWNFSGSTDSTDIFTRQITISPIDTKRKSITSTVTWQQNPQRTGLVSLASRLTNWLVSGIGNWSNPQQPASISTAGTANGNKVQVQGNYAYVVINTGSNPNFFVIDISNPDNPTIAGSLAMGGTPKNIAVSGNYAYVVGNSNSGELQIVDISNPASPTIAGAYNATGSTDMLGVYVVNTTVYMGRSASAQDEFYIVNAANPASPSLVGSLELGSSANANEIYISGNYAYVASSKSGQELQVLDISTPSAPLLTATLDLPGTQSGVTIAGFGNTVIVGRSGSGGINIIDVSMPASPTLTSTYSLAGATRDLSLGNNNNYLFVASDLNSAEFQVVDISNLASPTLVGSFNYPADLNGVAYSTDNDRAYVTSDYNNGEFAVMAPQ